MARDMLIKIRYRMMLEARLLDFFEGLVLEWSSTPGGGILNSPLKKNHQCKIYIIEINKIFPDTQKSSRHN